MNDFKSNLCARVTNDPAILLLLFWNIHTHTGTRIHEDWHTFYLFHTLLEKLGKFLTGKCSFKLLIIPESQPISCNVTTIKGKLNKGKKLWLAFTQYNLKKLIFIKRVASFFKKSNSFLFLYKWYKPMFESLSVQLEIKKAFQLQLLTISFTLKIN